MLSPVPTAHRDLVGVSSSLVDYGFRYGFLLGRSTINGLSSKKREMDKGGRRSDVAGVGNVGCGGRTFGFSPFRGWTGHFSFFFFERRVNTQFH